MTQISGQELDEIYAFAVDLGKRAGRLLLDGVNRRIDGSQEQAFVEKDNAVDIVTKTDEGRVYLNYVMLFSVCLLYETFCACRAACLLADRCGGVHQNCNSEEISLSQVSTRI